MEYSTWLRDADVKVNRVTGCIEAEDEFVLLSGPHVHTAVM